MKLNIKKILIYMIFIVYIFPRSFETVFPLIHETVNILKVIFIPFLVFIYFKKKIKISEFSFWAITYFAYIFIITLVKDLSIMTFLKTYIANFGMLLFCQILFNDEKRNDYIITVSHIFFAMLIINLVIMFYAKISFDTYYFHNGFHYFLGQDNRFILYMIPPVICYNYLYNVTNKLKYKNYLILTYIISCLTLILVWSASALVVMLGITLGNLFISKFKKIRLNLKILIIFLLIINVGVVFFRIQNVFSFIIVDVLHKSLHLSYRTDIWDFALNIIKNDCVSLIFGHGFFDITNVFAIKVINAYGNILTLNPNHLHNIIMNCLYFGGIIGTFLYANIYCKIVTGIQKIKSNKYIYNLFSVVLSSILVLLIFDTFEFYSLYYFILYLLFGLSYELKNSQKIS